MPDAEWDYLSSYEGRSQPLPARYAAIVAGYDNQFDLVRQAARAVVPCDWGIDPGRGGATLLPHLARAKAVATVTRVRALWTLQQGRQADAADDLAAVLVLGRNISRDGMFISSLVQHAIESIVCHTVAENFGRFSPETLQRLVDGFDAAPASGTIAATIPNEKNLFYGWAERRIRELQQQYPGDDAKALEQLRPYLAFSLPDWALSNRWERITQAAGGTCQGLLTLLREHEQIFDQFAAFLALPYPEHQARLAAFQDEIKRSPNPFTKDDGSVYLRSRMREFRAEVALAMVHAAVAYKLRGEAGLRVVNDPCGQGPFAFRRFIFNGVDRGFELRSAFRPEDSYPQVLIFVEKDGPPFLLDGPRAGQARR